MVQGRKERAASLKVFPLRYLFTVFHSARSVALWDPPVEMFIAAPKNY
jgi:hypothetical protein